MLHTYNTGSAYFGLFNVKKYFIFFCQPRKAAPVPALFKGIKKLIETGTMHL